MGFFEATELAVDPQGRCPYYQYEAEAGAPDPIHPGRAPSPITVYAYCNHRHSPAPPSVVLFTFAGRDLLKCGGDLGKCQVPSHLRGDLGPCRV